MGKIMKNIKSRKAVHYDSESDALYLGMKQGDEEEYVEVSPGVNVELDARGQVIGIEILNASRLFNSFFKMSSNRSSRQKLIHSAQR